MDSSLSPYLAALVTFGADEKGLLYAALAAVLAVLLEYLRTKVQR